MADKPLQVLALDSVRYRYLAHSKIPPAFGEVEVVLKDEFGGEVDTLLIAGLVAFQAYSGKHLRCGSNQEDGVEIDDGGRQSLGHDTVQPVCGWWLVEKKAR